VKKPLSSVFLGALLTIGSAVMAAGSDADPVVGTWKLNLAKSTFAGVRHTRAKFAPTRSLVGT